MVVNFALALSVWILNQKSYGYRGSCATAKNISHFFSSIFAGCPRISTKIKAIYGTKFIR